ncbi:MAG: hypothetical protein LBH25_01080 [Fibromonadaceae bacterium]|jgi:uncharacterized protein (TIGR02145 family)|nr:hypothetical protein [Fibromonadaceae bacterium]
METRPELGTFADPRDGKEYKTVKIGGQVWLAENLNWEGAGAWCNDNPAMGARYGRLYTWDEAMRAAPPGWHLPTDEEWAALTDFAGGAENAAEALKSRDWDGADELGFSALPGGYRYCDGVFYLVGTSGDWWSATEKDSEYACSRNIFGTKVCRNGGYKGRSFSIRLVRD